MRCGKEVGWLYDTGETEVWIKKEKFALPPADSPPEVLHTRRMNLLRDRIAWVRNSFIHRAGLVCYCYKNGAYQKAREACVQCQELYPDHWWPKLMLAYIDFQLGQENKADKQLIKFTLETNDLPHWFLVGQCYLAFGQEQKAKQALEKIAKAGPATLVTVDNHELAESEVGFYWHAALLCYQHQWWEECLVICDQWERFVQEHRGWEKSYWALRAACYLNQGKMVQAYDAVRRAMAKNRGWRET